MINAEWMIKQGYKFKNIDIRQRPRDFCIYGIYIGNALIDTYRCTNEMTYIEVVLKWLDMEHKEPILDDVEKRYLSSFIKPFKDEIRSIEKSRNWANNSDRLYFNMKNRDIFYLPSFKLGTMYKGMKPGKEYALDELCL